MKLGIVVVYMVKAENGELLDLHLRKIRALTTVPYTIYAGVRHLPSPLLQRLESEPQLEIVSFPETDLRGSAEHSFYLEHLVEHAMTDDVTHLVTMHVDSFPVRPGWDEEIAGQLNGDTVLATLSRDRSLIQYSACLFFRRDFWAEYRPRFLLTKADRASPEYERFYREQPHHKEDSGVGYVFRAHSEGKSFVALERSDASESGRHFGSVYADLVFHLEGAYRHDKLNEGESAAANMTRPKALLDAKNRIKRYIPEAIRRRVRRVSQPLIGTWEQPFYDEARTRLLYDSERYLSERMGTTDAAEKRSPKKSPRA